MKNIFRITFIALFINITCLNGVIPDVLGNTRDSNTIQNSRTKMVSNLNKLSDPEKEIVYSRVVKAGKRLKDGRLTFHVYAVEGNRGVVSNVSEFNIRASKK